VQDAARALGKRVNVYVKYVGDWYKPTEEREVARALVSQQKVDVLTQQTDSGSPLDVAQERGIWFVGKDMDIVGFYGWSNTDTVAVSFDTRWEVLYDRMVRARLAGNPSPRTLLYLGMRDTMALADGTVVTAVDIMNNKKVGVDAISPKARRALPESIVRLVAQRREQMMKGQWDPFQVHALVSNGTGLALKDAPIPARGTVVKKAGEMPSDEWLLSKFNFALEGMTILK
jgi:simple sugar transport system substrate-binding protein